MFQENIAIECAINQRSVHFQLANGKFQFKIICDFYYFVTIVTWRRKTTEIYKCFANVWKMLFLMPDERLYVRISSLIKVV